MKRFYVAKVAGSVVHSSDVLSDVVEWAKEATAEAWEERPGQPYPVEVFREDLVCIVVAEHPPPCVVRVKEEPGR